MGLSQGLFRVLSFCKWGPFRAMNAPGQVEEEQVNAVAVGPGCSASPQPLREIFLRLIPRLLLLLLLLLLRLLLLRLLALLVLVLLDTFGTAHYTPTS